MSREIFCQKVSCCPDIIGRGVLITPHEFDAAFQKNIHMLCFVISGTLHPGNTSRAGTEPRFLNISENGDARCHANYNKMPFPRIHQIIPVLWALQFPCSWIRTESVSSHRNLLQIITSYWPKPDGWCQRGVFFIHYVVSILHYRSENVSSFYIKKTFWKISLNVRKIKNDKYEISWKLQKCNKNTYFCGWFWAPEGRPKNMVF